MTNVELLSILLAISGLLISVAALVKTNNPKD